MVFLEVPTMHKVNNYKGKPPQNTGFYRFSDPRISSGIFLWVYQKLDLFPQVAVSVRCSALALTTAPGALPMAAPRLHGRNGQAGGCHGCAGRNGCCGLVQGDGGRCEINGFLMGLKCCFSFFSSGLWIAFQWVWSRLKWFSKDLVTFVSWMLMGLHRYNYWDYNGRGWEIPSCKHRPKWISFLSSMGESTL